MWVFGVLKPLAEFVDSLNHTVTSSLLIHAAKYIEPALVHAIEATQQRRIPLVKALFLTWGVACSKCEAEKLTSALADVQLKSQQWQPLCAAYQSWDDAVTRLASLMLYNVTEEMQPCCVVELPRNAWDGDVFFHLAERAGGRKRPLAAASLEVDEESDVREALRLGVGESEGTDVAEAAATAAEREGSMCKRPVVYKQPSVEERRSEDKRPLVTAARAAAALVATPAAASASSSRETSNRPTVKLWVKLPGPSYRTISVVADPQATVWNYKEQIHAAARPDCSIPPEEMKLLFGKKEIGGRDDDEKILDDYQMSKETTLHLLHTKRHKGGRPARSPPPPGGGHALVAGKAPEGGDPPPRCGARIRRDVGSGQPIYDSNDGWIEAEGLDVSRAQEWLRKVLDPQAQSLTLRPYGTNGNWLTYLLNKAIGASHIQALDEHLRLSWGTTLDEKPALWQKVPSEVHFLDEQLHELLVDSEGLPLLGDQKTGDFVLGYAQPTLIPVCNPSRGELQPPPARNGREIGAHTDSPSYGDIIITVGIFGSAHISLTNPPRLSSCYAEHLTLERQACISAGDAYVIFGKARWKMEHNVSVSPNEQAIQGLPGEIARVGITLRYFRRSFLDLAARKGGGVPCHGPQARSFPPKTFVDALCYDMSGKRKTAALYPYTLPAVVLWPNGGDSMYVHYLADGTTCDVGSEGDLIGLVPIEDVEPLSEVGVRRCRTSHNTRKLLHDLESEGGLEDILVEHGIMASVE